jgi:hypothetical protein
LFLFYILKRQFDDSGFNYQLLVQHTFGSR